MDILGAEMKNVSFSGFLTQQKHIGRQMSIWLAFSFASGTIETVYLFVNAEILPLMLRDFFIMGIIFSVLHARSHKSSFSLPVHSAAVPLVPNGQRREQMYFSLFSSMCAR